MRGAAGAVSSVVGGGQGRVLGRQEKPPVHGPPCRCTAPSSSAPLGLQMHPRDCGKVLTNPRMVVRERKTCLQPFPGSSPLADRAQQGAQEANRSCIPSGNTKSSPFSYLS